MDYETYMTVMGEVIMRGIFELYSLDPEDLGALTISPSQRQALGIPEGHAFCIPYLDMKGQLTSFYTAWKFTEDRPNEEFNHLVEIVQPPSTKNTTYLPPGLLESIQREERLIIVKDELLAAYLVQTGIPAISFSSQSSFGWRNSSLRVPAETEVVKNISPSREEYLELILPRHTDATEITYLADHLHDVIHTLISNHLYPQVLLAFTKNQEANAALRWELNLNGIAYDHVRQYDWPKPSLLECLADPKEWDRFLPTYPLSNFPPPVHPNLRSYLANHLASRMHRRDSLKYASYIMSELEARGSSHIDPETKNIYYFVYSTKELMRVIWGKQRDTDVFHAEPFGRFLFRTLGVNVNDLQLLNNIASFFTQPVNIDEISPQKTLYIKERSTIEGTSIYYQVSNNQFIEIPSAPQRIKLHDNGAEGIMFEALQSTQHLDLDLLFEAYTSLSNQPLECWWSDVYSTLNVVQLSEEVEALSKEVGFDCTKKLHSLIPYISPWFNTWNNTQLPIEIITGEAGSGKSSLMELRQIILTGSAHMRNSPTDLRDWYAGITNTGGMYVIDNVRFTSKQLQQRLSDEICRIITEPHPRVELRKLYTTSEPVYPRVNCTFAVTALLPPFHNQDLLQRSFPLHLNAIRHASHRAHVSRWADSVIEERGGREWWIAHHIVILQRILRGIERGWDLGYMSQNRLTNLEQLLRITAKVFWPRESTQWIIRALSAQIKAEGNIEQWTFDGLCDFLAQWYEAPTKYSGMWGFGSKEISQWAQSKREYRDNVTLTDSRMLAKFMISYQATIADETKIHLLGRAGNRNIFGPQPPSTNTNSSSDSQEKTND